MAATLDDLVRRLGELDQRYRSAKREDVQSAVREAERLARHVARQLRRAEKLVG